MTSIKLLLEEDIDLINKKFSLLNENSKETDVMADDQDAVTKQKNQNRVYGYSKELSNAFNFDKVKLEIQKKSLPILISSIKKNTVWGKTVINSFINDNKKIKTILTKATELYFDSVEYGLKNPKDFEKALKKAASVKSIAGIVGIRDGKILKSLKNDMDRSKNLIYNVLSEAYSAKDIAIHTKEYILESNKEFVSSMKFLLEEEESVKNDEIKSQQQDQKVGEEEATSENARLKAILEKGINVAALIALIMTNFYLLKQFLSELNEIVFEQEKIVKKYLADQDKVDDMQLVKGSAKALVGIQAGLPLVSALASFTPLGLASVFVFPIFMKGVDKLFNFAKSKAVDFVGRVKAGPATKNIGLFMYQNVGKSIISISETTRHKKSRKMLKEEVSKNNDILLDTLEFMQSKNILHYKYMEADKFSNVELNFAKKLSAFINVNFGLKTSVNGKASGSDKEKDNVKNTMQIIKLTASASEISKEDGKFNVSKEDRPHIKDVCKILYESEMGEDSKVVMFMKAMGDIHKYNTWEAFLNSNSGYDNVSAE